MTVGFIAGAVLIVFGVLYSTLGKEKTDEPPWLCPMLQVKLKNPPCLQKEGRRILQSFKTAKER